MSKVIINNIKKQLNNLQEGGLWLNESLKNKIDTLADDDVFKRPIPQIHSVAELVSHMLVWKKECMHRFSGSKTDLMNSPDNWKSNDELIKIGWAKLKYDFYESQSKLIQLIANQDDAYLENKYLDTDEDLQYLIEGIIHHDIYHLGQIGITIKLLNGKVG